MSEINKIIERIRKTDDREKRNMERKKHEELESQKRIELYESLSISDKQDFCNRILDCKLVDCMFENGYIPYIYNGCYGSSGISNEASFLLNLCLSMDSSDKYEGYIINREVITSEILTAKIILFLGKKSGDDYCKPVFDFVDINYYTYISLNEYDGLESIKFDNTKYIIAETKKILELRIFSDEKILLIKSIFEHRQNDVILKIKNAIDKFFDGDMSLCTYIFWS